MKKILVLTDFSASSYNAAQYANVLASQRGTSILLYNTVESIPIVPNYAGGGFVTETENLFAEESFGQLTQVRNSLLARQGKGPIIEILIGEGDLGSNIKKLLNEQAIELIVMGAPQGSLINHLLTGSETRSVIKSANRPVLIIPGDKPIKPFNNFVLATDYRSADLCALRYLSAWIAVIGGRLDVVHIQTSDEVPQLTAQQRQVFELFLNNLSFNNFQCHDLQGKDILERLDRFCQDKKADVLAMINYHHDFFSRLLGNSQTFKELRHLQLLMLVFPGNFNDETTA
ncbi:universal stress protein [Mucilaginibacter sp. AK015]|uniref:universal stress protein n=1 Tax=Mucilaginibacter sp. AK015 TaxID=2723072 RepID=UPI00160CB8DB|nr:universal stress protein [Mucilaginibacter sp. AK015]MBB5396866.1 nucleotide-binding universal stress UspA family protein [Mucilaginibacter sp. AK015]